MVTRILRKPQLPRALSLLCGLQWYLHLPSGTCHETSKEKPSRRRLPCCSLYATGWLACDLISKH